MSNYNTYLNFMAIYIKNEKLPTAYFYIFDQKIFLNVQNVYSPRYKNRTWVSVLKFLSPNYMTLFCLILWLGVER